MDIQEALTTLKAFCRQQEKCDECVITEWCNDWENWGVSPRMWELHLEEDK